MPSVDPLIRISRDLSVACRRLTFSAPVAFVYNPLEYARRAHEAYLSRWGAARPREILLLGMNPGPFGMAQTGVPFGDVPMVRDFLGICEAVGRPVPEHPRRPVHGFECTRREVSGTRFWGWAADRFGSADAFLRRFFVVNWCPLVFMEEGGRNRTPDKLAIAEREALFPVCDHALRRIVAILMPRYVIGVGAFAAGRAKAALADQPSIRLGSILHPSPASPAANRDWANVIEKQLGELGIHLPVMPEKASL